jgi:hypothetical protein
MDSKEAVAIIRSNWPDIRYSMLRDREIEKNREK